MARFFKRVGHGLLFTYVFYYVMTRNLETVYEHYHALVMGAIP